VASAEDHVQALLQLPSEDRARAIQLLLESLDGEPKDPEAEARRAAELAWRARAVIDGTDEVKHRVEQAWAVEIERRLSRIDAGQAKLVSVDEAVIRLQRAARGQDVVRSR
jgi:hypothetical protein